MSTPPLEEPRRKLTGAIVPALALAGLAGLAAMLLVSRPDRAPGIAAPEGCILEEQGAGEVGGPIALIDINGQRVTQRDFAGEPVVLYFGFTHCPQVCPTALYALGEMLRLPGGYDIQTALITVDPARDRPNVLAAYVQTEGFPAGLVGLTGSEAQVGAAVSAFRVYSQVDPGGDAPEAAYNVDHSSMFYVLDGDWRVRAILRSENQTPDEIAACIAAGLGEHSS